MIRLLITRTLQLFIIVIMFLVLKSHWEDRAIQSTEDLIIGGVVFLVIGCAALAFVSKKMAPKDVAARWREGRVGVGTVQSFSRSGLRKGVRAYQIKMDVESEDGARFQGSMVAAVGRRRLGSVVPGAQFPVIFQPKKPAALYVPHGPFRERAQLFFDFVCLRDGFLDQATFDAMYHGAPARATIIQHSVTGRTIPGKHEVQLKLTVFTPHGESFPSTATLFVDSYEKASLVQANYVEARYLPHWREKVAVQIPRLPQELR
ncbi:hypothetical protein WG915_06655 [Corynebacterium sp. H128]|uniref:hypothetical protein n=1 Tax=unclassified Corynebacterium TaxID=2624378 RepID=UPI0030A2E070